MSEPAGKAASTPGTAGQDITHEAYAFACMRCGNAWEEAYEIEHHIDASGRTVLAYTVAGRRVPSPLSRPTCENCEGHLVRIMRAGTVSNPQLHAALFHGRGRGGDASATTAEGAIPRQRDGEHRRRRPHLPHFLHRRPPADAG